MQNQLAQLERKYSELAALRRIVMAINSQIDDLDRVVNLILTSACELLSADHGSLMLIQPELQTLKIVAFAGKDWTAEKQTCSLALGEGITGRVAVKGQPYVCPDVTKDPHYYPLFPDILSEVAVPVISQGRILGVINIDSTRMNAFSPADCELLQMLADHAAMAIENTRQFAAAQAARDQWQQIFDALPDGILVCDEQLIVLRINLSFLNIFGVAGNSLLGHSAEKILSETPMLHLRRETWRRLRETGVLRIRFRDPHTQRSFQIFGIRSRLGGKTAFLICFRETTLQRSSP